MNPEISNIPKFHTAYQEYHNESKHPTLLAIGAIESCHTKLRFGQKKLLDSTLFAAGGNNTFELINNQENFTIRMLYRIIMGFLCRPKEMEIVFGFCRTKYNI